MEGLVGIDRLKDHYKHCIRLSASNKISPQNAFDLQLIDYLHDLVSNTQDGQMTFKIASCALDLGAKIYSNRVDNIHSAAQKVASGLMLAVEGSESKQDESVCTNASERDDEPAQPKEKRKRTKNVKTVVTDTNLLDSSLEKIVLGDAFLDRLSSDFDMSCPAALICYNALTQKNCLMTVESDNLRRTYCDKSATTESPHKAEDQVTLITKHANCAQIIRNNLYNHICPRLESFLFNDRTTKISGIETNETTAINEDRPTVAATKIAEEAHDAFDPAVYNDSDDDCGNDAVDDDIDLNGNLNRVAASKPSDYEYAKQARLLNTWAGPHAWKPIRPQTVKKTARKRAKIEIEPIKFSEEYSPTREVPAKKATRHSSLALKRWRKPILPPDHNLDEEQVRDVVVHKFMKPEETYQVEETVEAQDYSLREEEVASPALGGFDDLDDDQECAESSFIEQDLEFAGEHLIDEPYMVTQVNIPFAKTAKRMDVRKLKRVMWDYLAVPVSANTSTATDAANITVVAGGDAHNQSKAQEAADKTSVENTTVYTTRSASFQELYGELPVRVSSKMANDLSQPIAFVTLLHLTNEKNLKLIPKPDLHDFNIEKD